MFLSICLFLVVYYYFFFFAAVSCSLFPCNILLFTALSSGLDFVSLYVVVCSIYIFYCLAVCCSYTYLLLTHLCVVIPM